MKSEKARQMIERHWDNVMKGEKRMSMGYNISMRALDVAEQELSEHIPQWHDLRKNPQDLPEYHHSVLLAVDNWFPYGREVGWLVPEQNQWHFYGDEHPFDSAIGWCEIPKFE